jgi:hypothetical protein
MRGWLLARQGGAVNGAQSFDHSDSDVVPTWNCHTKQCVGLFLFIRKSRKLLEADKLRLLYIFVNFAEVIGLANKLYKVFEDAPRVSSDHLN